MTHTRVTRCYLSFPGPEVYHFISMPSDDGVPKSL